MRGRLPRVRFRLWWLMVAVAVVGVSLGAFFHLFVRLPALRAVREVIDYHRRHAHKVKEEAEHLGRLNQAAARSELLALSAWHQRRAEELERLDPLSISRAALVEDRRESRAVARRFGVRAFQAMHPTWPPEVID